MSKVRAFDSSHMAGPKWKVEDPTPWGTEWAKEGCALTGAKQAGLRQDRGIGSGKWSRSPSVCWVHMAWAGRGQREVSDMVDPGASGPDTPRQCH